MLAHSAPNLQWKRANTLTVFFPQMLLFSRLGVALELSEQVPQVHSKTRPTCSPMWIKFPSGNQKPHEAYDN